MHGGMFDSKRHLHYWDRRMRRDLVLAAIFFVLAAAAIVSIFIQGSSGRN